MSRVILFPVKYKFTCPECGKTAETDNEVSPKCNHCGYMPDKVYIHQ